MQIKITDEGVRRTLTFAVWEQAHHAFGDGTNAFYDESRGAVERDDWLQELVEADETVELLRTTLRDADRIRTAQRGDTIDLETSPDALQSGIAGCADYVRENERFWDSIPAERQRQTETFDAAQRLLSTAEAVA
jgi:hypothetical protein